MGYDLHLTRRTFWADSRGPAITFDEWCRHVASDPTLAHDADNSEEDFLFVGHPNEPAPLWWNRGEVYTKNPDQPTVRKLIEIAQVLGARVVGDDGETYSDWRRYPSPDP
jgi:hypothetical protein